ncbi:MAG: 23S rRNA (pseudouridine(1915)-N(3))-methyltransferase RlmH [Clostridiales Family XIII bacterium]|jgi:23S rRNA (pseudouridine1915-N3)-methyltransferase|nr:23S rRNA (pseudouridine(1915)-N(3))-methyltransferase RlmH [Clostridiales Family XIII bacterium]
MNIDIICVGTLKEKYWKDAAAEYLKRLSGFCTVSIVEVKEAPLPAKARPAEEAAVILAEGKALLAQVHPRSYVIALDVRGKELSSEALAVKIKDLTVNGESRIAFIIGGSLGLSKELLDGSDMRLSFSRMTYPHQLMRVILLEQIYRSFKINRGETYHK